MTHKQEKRLAVIQLLALGLSQAEVAKKVGVSRQLISTWMKNPDFQKQVIEKKQGLTDRASDIEALSSTSKANNLIDFPSVTKKPIRFNVETFRQQELQFLQNIEDSLTPLLAEGSIRAASTLLKLSEIRARLLGLNQKNLPLLEAVNMLLSENVLSELQANIVNVSIHKLENDLRNFDDEQQTNTQ